MIEISEDQLKRLLQVKLSYNSLVDLQDANLYEIRIALNEVIKELTSERQTNSNTDISSRLHTVSFELMVENLFEDYIEKLNIKTHLQYTLQEKYGDVVNMGNDLHLDQGYIDRFAVGLLKKFSKQGKFCKAYSIFYKSSQFKQQIVDRNRVETTFHEPKTSVVFKRSTQYDTELDNNKIKSQVYDIPCLNENTDFIRLFAPKANSNPDYEDFIRGGIGKIYSKENKIDSIRQFVYTPEIDEFGEYIEFLQQRFLSDSIVEDMFNDETKFFKNADEIEQHIQINIAETNASLVIISFLQKLLDLGYSFEKTLRECNKIFGYININLHKESFELMDLGYLYQFEGIKNITELINGSALKNGYPEIIKEDFLDCFNLIASISHEIIVGSNYYRKYLLESEYIDIDINIQSKITIQAYGFSDDLFNSKTDYDNLYSSKLKYKRKLVNKYNLKNTNDKSIFNIQLSDFHEGKRQVSNVFYILYLCLKLKDNISTTIMPTTFFIGGAGSFGYFFYKKTISLCTDLSKITDSDKLIQEKVKLVFVESIMLDRLPDLAKANDTFNYIPRKNLDVSDTYPYTFMNNGSILLTSDSNVYENINNLNENNGVLKFDKKISANTESSCMNFILENIGIVKSQKVVDEFYEIYNLIIKYSGSSNMINSSDNFAEANEEIQKTYLDENLWNGYISKNIGVSDNFRTDYLKGY